MVIPPRSSIPVVPNYTTLLPRMHRVSDFLCMNVLSLLAPCSHASNNVATARNLQRKALAIPDTFIVDENWNRFSKFWSPKDITAMSSGDLLVSDPGHRRLHIVSPQGETKNMISGPCL